MNAVRLALCALLLGTTVGVLGAEPTARLRWRAVTAAEGPYSGTAPLATERVAPQRASDAPSAQIVFFDPVTNTILPRPPVSARQRHFAPLRQADAGPEVELRATPEGYLYIDLSAYPDTVTTALGTDGRFHQHCGNPTHDHALAVEGEPAQ